MDWNFLLTAIAAPIPSRKEITIASRSSPSHPAEPGENEVHSGLENRRDTPKFNILRHRTAEDIRAGRRAARSISRPGVVVAQGRNNLVQCALSLRRF